jgi:hypothetical protein
MKKDAERRECMPHLSVSVKQGENKTPKIISKLLFVRISKRKLEYFCEIVEGSKKLRM